MRCPDAGIKIGSMQPGTRDKITDVPGVRVGHFTLDTPLYKTGVTAVLPSEDIFENKLRAACFVQNGYGKTTGLIQVDELGQLETPIFLTGTLSVGTVWQGAAEYSSGLCRDKGQRVFSVNPVVCECNDSALSKSEDFPLQPGDVLKAVEDAREDFAEGSVGGGTGLVCHQLKGGIGSASRLVKLGDTVYTVGILALCNHGSLHDLTINGERTGKSILDIQNKEDPDEGGSVIIIMATDAPLSDRQLKRVLKRCTVGLARDGSYLGQSSGDVFVGFSTCEKIRPGSCNTRSTETLDEMKMNYFFRAAAEGVEESVLNCLLSSPRTVGFDGQIVRSLNEYGAEVRGNSEE